MIGLIVRLIINAIALFVADLVIPGIQFDDWTTLLIVALIFGLVNALIKPIVSFVTCFISLLTLGLFTLIINALMLLLTAAIAQAFGLGFRVDGFWSAFFGAIIISLVSLVLTDLSRRRLT